MRKCQKCGREFAETEREHDCVEAPADIDEYIGRQPEEIRPILYKTRDTIRAAIPGATEKISWKMPTFWMPVKGSRGENLIHFAAHKNHLGIYPGDLTMTPFAEKIAGYKSTKGAVQFAYNKPVPYELIAEIAAYRARVVGEKAEEINKSGRLGGGRGNDKPAVEDPKVYEFEAVIHKTPDRDGAYVEFPYDLRTEFGRGRVKVRATFDGEPYDGSIVNMGVKNPDGSVCYIIGVRKDIRAKIGKTPGETVKVTVREDFR